MSIITSTQLDWLPPAGEQWNALAKTVKSVSGNAGRALLAQLANHRLDLTQTLKLDRTLTRALTGVEAPEDRPLRLAVLGSSTLSHLLPGIRVGALRRQLILDCYMAPYGAYRQDLSNRSSALHRFDPDIILLAFDARHAWSVGHGDVDQALDHLARCWADIQSTFRCTIIQQGILPVFLPSAGNNEHRLVRSPFHFVEQLNVKLRAAADAFNVHLLSIDQFHRWMGGLDFWHDTGLWNHAKQDVSPAAAHLYGEMLARVIAVSHGIVAKCFVLDLDNTIWGGVIGDDGLEGIVLGQGSPDGEAFVQIQQYIKAQQERGIILAVCSKNDEANALLPFRNHAEMILKQEDIAHFTANWSNKPDNIVAIAESLNIKLDSMVFVDDNPVERGLVRQRLPMVLVPELPDDPNGFVRCLQRSGYFEAISFTTEDSQRTDLYRANASRENLKSAQSSVEDYLAALRMELYWNPLDRKDLSRIVQLANKTNQFNLTTQRWTETDVLKIIDDESSIGLQFRLTDIYGDNGLISIVHATRQQATLNIENWLMSCRVLERGVEYAVFSVICNIAKDRGIATITGSYRKTGKNGIVANLYEKLGFTLVEAADENTDSWQLVLESYSAPGQPITIKRSPNG